MVLRDSDFYGMNFGHQMEVMKNKNYIYREIHIHMYRVIKYTHAEKQLLFGNTKGHNVPPMIFKNKRVNLTNSLMQKWQNYVQNLRKPLKQWAHKKLKF